MLVLNTARTKRPRSFASLPVFNEYPYVPDPGKFAEFTLNVPNDAGPVSGYSAFANWNGGCYVADCGEHGAACYHGGGEHYTYADHVGVIVLDIKARTYRSAATSPLNPHWGGAVGPTGYQGDATDEYGAYASNGYPQTRHSYNSIQEMPSAWGGGPLGSMVRVAQTGGPSVNSPNNPVNWQGYAATWKFDLSVPVGGMTKLTGNNKYNYGNLEGAVTLDNPHTGVDYVRKGWWSKSPGGMGDGLCFTSHTGVITNYFTPIRNTYICQIHHFADEDLLVTLDGFTEGPSDVWMTTPPDMPGAGWVKATLSEQPTTHPLWLYLGNMGMRWCSHPNVQAFLGFDYSHQGLSNNQCRIFQLKPPPVGQRRTGTWEWTQHIVESEDGSIMMQNDASSYNGAFGRLVYCPPLQCLVWSRDAHTKGQLIRLPTMVNAGGPPVDPPDPPEEPPPDPDAPVLKLSGEAYGTSWGWASRALFIPFEDVNAGDYWDINGIAQGPTRCAGEIVPANWETNQLRTFDISGIDGDLYLHGGITYWKDPKIDGVPAKAYHYDNNAPTFLRNPTWVENPTRGNTLTLEMWNGSIGAEFRIDKVRLPVITIAPMIPGGLAATVSTDLELATHPQVLTYLDVSTQETLWSKFLYSDMSAPWAFDPEFITGPRGLPVFRFASSFASRLIAWWLRFPSQTEAYSRYCFFIEDDVYDGINELGVKMPGISGLQEISWRMEHGGKAIGNRGLWAALDYLYNDEQATGGGFPTLRSMGPTIIAGRWHTFEQHIKVNSFVNGVPQDDGIARVWMNGNLTFEDLSVRHRQKTDTFVDHLHINFYHGGLAWPLQPMHYRIAGLVVAKQYIGPPPELIP